KALFELRRTRDADATIGRLTFFPVDPGPAYRTMGRHDKAPLLACSFVRQNLYDVWTNVAGALDHDGVSSADVFAFYVIHVVQRGALDCYTTDGHRLQARNRG